jgi:hypothetical protein
MLVDPLVALTYDLFFAPELPFWFRPTTARVPQTTWCHPARPRPCPCTRSMFRRPTEAAWRRWFSSYKFSAPQISLPKHQTMQLLRSWEPGSPIEERRIRLGILRLAGIELAGNGTSPCCSQTRNGEQEAKAGASYTAFAVSVRSLFYKLTCPKSSSDGCFSSMSAGSSRRCRNPSRRKNMRKGQG